MGQPLRVGTRAEKYSRVQDRQAFDETMDAIRRPKDPDRPRRAKYVYRDGKLVCLEADGKQLAESPAFRKTGERPAPDLYNSLKAASTGLGSSIISPTTSAEVNSAI